MAEGVFVSYRRDDAPGHAGRLYDRLISRFGEGRVFMDVDSIEPGEDFVNAIESTLAGASVVVVVIGPTWVSARDEKGVVRLGKPDDFVHLEVSRALQLRKRVIPVLVDDAPVPGAEELPQDLRQLARLNAIEISDVRFHADADRLADAIEEVMAGSPAAVGARESVPTKPIEPTEPIEPTVVPPGPVAPATERDDVGQRLRRLGLPVVIAVVIALLMIIGAVVWALSSGDDTDTGPDTTIVATTAGGSAATTASTAASASSPSTAESSPSTAESSPSTAGTEPAPPLEPAVIADLPTTGPSPELVVAGGSLWASVDGGVERFEPPGPDARSAGVVDLGGPGYGNDLLDQDGRLLVTRYDGRAVVGVDMASGTTQGDPVAMPGGALGMVSSAGSLWVTAHGSSSGAPGSIVEVRDGAVVGEIPLDQRPFSIEAVADRLWVTFFDAGSIAMIDPASGQVTMFPVGVRPVDVRFIGGMLWVTVSGEDRIALVDPASGAVTGDIPVGSQPWKLAEGFGAVWVTNQGDDTVMRIDPTTLEPGEPIPVGAKPDEIAIGDEQVFVGNFGGSSISVIDPGQ